MKDIASRLVHHVTKLQRVSAGSAKTAGYLDSVLLWTMGCETAVKLDGSQRC